MKNTTTSEVGYTVDGHAAFDIEGMYAWLDLMTDPPGLPPTVQQFRQRVWYYTRKGFIPPPVRVPRNDGKRGTVGVYPMSSMYEIENLLNAREEKGKTRERLPRLPGKGGQRLYGVSLWLPDPLGQRIEAQIQAGHPISEQLLIGTRLLAEMEEFLRFEILGTLKDWRRDRDVRAWEDVDTRWQYASCFLLADHILEQLASLQQQTGIHPTRLAWRCKFEFKVLEGGVRVTAVQVRQDDGTFKRIEVRGV